jgi:pimeloyl-ACP methyl ester carboxylesterase
MPSPSRAEGSIVRVKRRRRLLLAGALVALLAVPNLLAVMHARAMTRFTDGGERTDKPELLSLGQKAKALALGVRIARPKSQRTPADIGLGFETQRFESEPGVELEAWRIPREKSRGVAVLFHGYAASKEQTLAPARLLHELGYETLLVDFRGSGGSSGSETSIGYHEARDVASAVARTGRKDVVLFGHSMGAVAILRAIHAHGVEARAVILEAPFDRMLTTVENRFASMGVPSFPAARLLVFWGGVLGGFDALAHDPIAYARSVKVPALVIGGADDARVTRSQLESVADALAGPKKLVVFEKLGHESFSEARPAEWRAAVETFLTER